MTRILLDTHVLLWAWTTPERLSRRARNLLANHENFRLVSAVTAFEISSKFSLGKLPVEPALVHSYSDHLAKFGATELPITSQHGLAAGRLVSNHKDPFDRLLAAQSLLEGIPLLTADPAFATFGISTIW